MNKEAFIQWLQLLQTNGEVVIWDEDCARWMPVIGASYHSETIYLYSNDINVDEYEDSDENEMEQE